MQNDPALPAAAVPRDRDRLLALRFAAWGLGGGLLLALVTSGAPLPDPAVVALGLTGMGVVVLTWLGLGRRAGETAAGRLYWIAASWCLPMMVARPLFSGDVHSYLAQGLIAAHGVDPYSVGPAEALGADSQVVQRVSHYWQDTPAPYGPAFVALSRTIAQIAGDNLVATVLLHRILALAGIALMAWALPRLARRVGVSPSIALWLGLLNPLVLWHVVAGAHNDGLMVGLLLSGLEVALSGVALTGGQRLARITVGVVVISVGANIKIVAAAALAFLGAELFRSSRRNGRFAVALGLPTVMAAVTITISVGTGLGFGWIGALADVSGQVHSWLAPTNQLGFLVGGVGALAGLSLTSVAIKAFSTAGLVVGFVVVANLMWLTFRGRFNPLLGAGLAFAAILVFGPVVQPWYLLWAIPLLAVSLTADRERWILAAVSAVFAILIPPAGGSIVALISGYATAILLLGGALLAVRRDRARSTIQDEDKTEQEFLVERVSGR